MEDIRNYRELYNFVTEQDPNALEKLMIFEKLLLMRCGFEWLSDDTQDQIVEKLHSVYAEMADKVKLSDFLGAVYELIYEDLKGKPEKIKSILSYVLHDETGPRPVSGLGVCQIRVCPIKFGAFKACNAGIITPF